jgi:hypothetical protein
MAAVDGQVEGEIRAAALSRRAMLAGLAASPVFAATAANAATALPIWGIRKGSVDKPESVKKGCNVEKPCAKGAAFPFSDRSNKEQTARAEKALNEFKKRQPAPPPES